MVTITERTHTRLINGEMHSEVTGSASCNNIKLNICNLGRGPGSEFLVRIYLIEHALGVIERGFGRNSELLEYVPVLCEHGHSVALGDGCKHVEYISILI